MAGFASALLAILAGVLAVPVVLFCIEILAALFLRKRDRLSSLQETRRPRIAVLIPAHNESRELLVTLGDVKTQTQLGDRILLIADNCTDDTASVAKEGGAEVIERHDPAKQGKGYALEWGLRHLRDAPPEVVIIIDADCRLAAGAIDRLASACMIMNRPIQALYLMTAPNEFSIDYKVAVFAFRVKNWVRPLGLQALGLPCQLMGTGMAVPWELINSVNLASGAIVEDMKLGLDLARIGYPPYFCTSAGISSQFPLSIKGAKSQRQRWEKGHVGMIARSVPICVGESIARGNYGLLALSLDMAVPPLILLGMMITATLLLSFSGALLGLSPAAFIVSATSLLAYFLAVLLCWFKYGRDILPVTSFPSVASYVAGKVPLYHRIVSQRDNAQWVRTDRGKDEEKVGLPPNEPIEK